MPIILFPSKNKRKNSRAKKTLQQMVTDIVSNGRYDKGNDPDYHRFRKRMESTRKS